MPVKVRLMRGIAPTGYLNLFAFDGAVVHRASTIEVSFYFFYLYARATDVDDTYTLYRGGVRGAVTERSVPRDVDRRGAARPNTARARGRP